MKPEKDTNKTKRTAQIHKNIRQTNGWKKEYKKVLGQKP
jgi:hypothetical protein